MNHQEIAYELFPNYQWEGLDSEWKTLLMSDKFRVKDTIGDGNCQFRAIETALKCKSKNDGSHKKQSHLTLRKLAGKYTNSGLNLEEFKNILEHYREEVVNGEFRGDWNPDNTKSKRQFIQHLKTPGFHFEGDDVTLSLLSRVLKIDFMIFTDTYSMFELNSDNPDLVILYYNKTPDGSNHYQTIGLAISDDKKIQSIFNRKNLPREVEILLNKDLYILEHTKTLKYQTLHELSNLLEKKLSMKIPRHSKRVLYQNLARAIN